MDYYILIKLIHIYLSKSLVLINFFQENKKRGLLFKILHDTFLKDAQKLYRNRQGGVGIFTSPHYLKTNEFIGFSLKPYAYLYKD